MKGDVGSYVAHVYTPKSRSLSEREANGLLLARAPILACSHDELLGVLKGLYPFIHEDGMAKSELSPFKVAWLKAESVIARADALSKGEKA